MLIFSGHIFLFSRHPKHKGGEKPLKFQKWVLFFVCICVLNVGCSPQKSTSAPPALVTAVDVQYDFDTVHLQRKYTATDKMDAVLYYLYGLSPYGQAEEDPEQLTGESCCITVTLSNGQIRTYRQQAGRYIRIDSSPWKKIDPQKAARLLPLVEQMPSDTNQLTIEN